MLPMNDTHIYVHTQICQTHSKVNAVQQPCFSNQRILPCGTYMLIHRPMLGQAMFIVPLHLYYSLHVHIVHVLDQFRSHMIMMDVDMCLGLQCNCQSKRDGCALGWQTAIWEWAPSWLRMADCYLILCHFPQWFICLLEPILKQQPKVRWSLFIHMPEASCNVGGH